jgi:hypothetical protein
MLKTGSNLAIGSDADGDMYYRASSVLASLAKGTADHKMFMNAGGTAPEWASGVKYMASTRGFSADSGDVSYTGVGFKPSAILAICGIASGNAVMSIGFAGGTGTNGGSLADSNAIAAGSYQTSASFFILLIESPGKYITAQIKTFDSDGFTLTWARTGSTTAVTINLQFLCFR